MRKAVRDLLLVLTILPGSMETIEIHASPDKVGSLKEFAGIAQWHPMLTECKATGGNSLGAERTLTLKTGARSVRAWMNPTPDAACSVIA